MNNNMTDLSKTPIVWKEIELEIEDDLFIYKAFHDGKIFLIRLNGFPDEVLYTLFIDNKIAVDFEDWPKLWKKN